MLSHEGEGCVMNSKEFSRKTNREQKGGSMTIVLGSDHAGFDLKKDLILFINELGHKTVDVGTDGTDPVDYPDYAEAVGKTLMDNQADRGIVICGSGVGASVAVNKMPGIRAGLCHDTYSAHQGVEHDNINVLVLGARIIGAELAHDIVKTYLNADFSNEERHVRRLKKLRDMETRYRSI
jgi:RpiB/LacA/LacB family sugar-phosphate isomerase